MNLHEIKKTKIMNIFQSEYNTRILIQKTFKKNIYPHIKLNKRYR